jgi:hypothetical protein
MHHTANPANDVYQNKNQLHQGGPIAYADSSGSDPGFPASKQNSSHQPMDYEQAYHPYPDISIRVCYNCGKKGHQKLDCPNLKRTKRQINYLRKSVNDTSGLTSAKGEVADNLEFPGRDTTGGIVSNEYPLCQ